MKFMSRAEEKTALLIDNEYSLPFIVRPPTPDEVAADPRLQQIYTRCRVLLDTANERQLPQAKREAFALALIGAMIRQKTPVISLADKHLKRFAAQEQNIPLSYSNAGDGYASTAAQVRAVLVQRFEFLKEIPQQETCAPEFSNFAKSAIKLFKATNDSVLAEIGFDSFSVVEFFSEKCQPLTQEIHRRRSQKIQKLAERKRNRLAKSEKSQAKVGEA